MGAPHDNLDTDSLRWNFTVAAEVFSEKFLNKCRDQNVNLSNKLLSFFTKSLNDAFNLEISPKRKIFISECRDRDHNRQFLLTLLPKLGRVLISQENFEDLILKCLTESVQKTAPTIAPSSSSLLAEFSTHDENQYAITRLQKAKPPKKKTNTPQRQNSWLTVLGSNHGRPEFLDIH